MAADTASLPIASAAPHTLAKFLIWEQAQELRHEWVGGRPWAMTGGTQAHNRIARNICRFLEDAPRGKPCEPFMTDLKVVIDAPDHVRYPDVVLDCAPFAANATQAGKPTLVVEVLAKPTAWFDQTEKMDDYAAVSSIAGLILIDQNKRQAQRWRREGEALVRAELLSDADAIPIAALDASLPFAATYGGLEVPAPGLAQSPPAEGSEGG
jgi:Uma2 family endonuclease